MKEMICFPFPHLLPTNRFPTIASWLKTLKNDKRYIFNVTSAASKVHRYLMDKNAV